MVTYVIAATPRCGGTLLCETLTATGLAGNPAEYFEPTSRLAADAAEVGLDSAEAAARDLSAYAAAIRRRHAGGNGVFGVKLHRDQAEWLHAHGTSVEALLGPCRFVYLTRGDLTRQAISLVRAKQTGAWSSLEPPRCEPVFDPGQIRDMITWLARANAGWESYFASRPDEPLRVTYETFVPDRAAVANAILGFLGIAHDAAEVERRLAESPGRLARQADTVSAEWLRLWTEYLRTLPLADAPQVAVALPPADAPLVAGAPQEPAAKPQGAQWPWSRRGRGTRAT